MKPPSSSTSSSEPAGAGPDPEPAPDRPGGGLRDAAIVAAWMLAALALMDVAVDRTFRLPRDPRVKATNPLVTYFNYGTSIEGKIRREVGPSDESTSLLAMAGWVDEQARSNPGAVAPPGGILASFYGMSFSSDVAKQLAEVEPRVGLRLFGGPAAPANHSHAIAGLDRGGQSDVMVLGVLASSVKGVATNNGMTWRFENPAPFTYPRHEAGASGLEARWPMVRTLDDTRAALADPALWGRYLAQLRATDDFYNDFLFRHDLSDSSTLVRMVRRAVAQRWEAARAARTHGPKGFVESSPAMASLRAIVAAFAAGARRDGKVPVVLLLEDQGYGDHLGRALEPVLGAGRIPHLATHTVCSPTDRRNFLPDGHFTEEANRKNARALLEVIRRELPGRLDPRG